LHNGNCVDVLKTMEDNSVDSVVTDPPYELGFMGKSWDSSGIAYSVEMWSEVMRVLKPGGHLLAFSGTRTYHRMVVAIEDAGFDIRDQIGWVYGSGFPKSMNIGKAIDKEGIAPSESIEKFRIALIAAREKKGLSRQDISELIVGTPSGACWNWESGLRIPSGDNWEKLVDVLELPSELRPLRDAAEREIVGKKKVGIKNGAASGSHSYGMTRTEVNITAPATEEAKQWDGWGTALKPAWEPICVARKPLSEKTVAKNVLKHGTGGININDCRVGNETRTYDLKGGENLNNLAREGGNDNPNAKGCGAYGIGAKQISIGTATVSGRFPANIIHDGSDEVVALFPESKGQQGDVKGTEPSHTGNDNTNCYGEYQRVPSAKRGDTGSAARFFYCAKASKSDRDSGLDGFDKKAVSNQKGNGIRRVCNKCGAYQIEPCDCTDNEWIHPENKKNNHPTVKPTDLMKYLCRLVTPKGGTVLDPFNGSGSTGKAAMLEGFNYIGIDLDPDYIKISQARIQNAKEQYEKEQNPYGDLFEIADE